MTLNSGDLHIQSKPKSQVLNYVLIGKQGFFAASQAMTPASSSRAVSLKRRCMPVQNSARFSGVLSRAVLLALSKISTVVLISSAA